MAHIAVVYHSGYGHTQRLAQAVAEGAGAELIAIDADGNLPEGGWETLAGASAGFLSGATSAALYCFHCPETAAPFILIWYTLGILLTTALGALLGRWILRW